jgi:hypothetical protein
MVPIRDLEADVINRERTTRARDYALAEEILDFGSSILFGRRIRIPEGDELLGRIVVGLLIKTLQVFWAVIVLNERGLPASSVVRELIETLVSITYLLREDSVERARLYVDHITIRDLKDMNARLNDPDTEDVVTPEYRQAVQTKVRELQARRGDEFEDMRNWPTWGGSFSLETMARRAGIPGTVYNLPWRFESRAPHALDIPEYLTVTATGDLMATRLEVALRDDADFGEEERDRGLAVSSESLLSTLRLR